MRRILMGVMLVAGLLVLAGCGNKGPLVRPPATKLPAAKASAATTAPSGVVAPVRGASPAMASSAGTTP